MCTLLILAGVYFAIVSSPKKDVTPFMKLPHGYAYKVYARSVDVASYSELYDSRNGMQLVAKYVRFDNILITNECVVYNATMVLEGANYSVRRIFVYKRGFDPKDISDEIANAITMKETGEPYVKGTGLLQFESNSKNKTVKVTLLSQRIGDFLYECEFSVDEILKLFKGHNG